VKNSVADFLSVIPVIDDDMYSKYVNLGFFFFFCKLLI
jgi:hypothetical protein